VPNDPMTEEVFEETAIGCIVDLLMGGGIIVLGIAAVVAAVIIAVVNETAMGMIVCAAIAVFCFLVGPLEIRCAIRGLKKIQ